MTILKQRSNGWWQLIFCLMCLIEALTICLIWMSVLVPVPVSAASSDVLFIRHGRSRVRHSSEKSHIRWGLQAFDNLTLYDYDYENANGTAGSNETMYEFGGNGGNQTFLGADSFGYYSSEMVYNNGTSANASVSLSDSKLISTLEPSSTSNRWSASTSSVATKSKKLAKKQFMESIRKNVEEGIEYLRTHAHLSHPTAMMPSEKALLQLQKQAEQLALAEKLKLSAQNDKLDSKPVNSFASEPIATTKHNIKSPFPVPFDHIHAEHIPLNQKKHKTDKQMPPWRAEHQIDDTHGNTNHIDQPQNPNPNQFDYEMQNDETHNQNVHQSDSHHPYKSNKLNKSNARHAHEPSTSANVRSNSIATMKTIDSIVTSINAAVSKKYLDQAFNDAKSNLNGNSSSNSNASRSNFRSQSNNSKLASRIQQSANEKRKELNYAQAKSADTPISSVASLTSHAEDIELTKQNDSNAKFNTNLNNNQFEVNQGFPSQFDELNDEQQTNDDSGDDTNPYAFDSNDEQTMTFDGKMVRTNDGTQLPMNFEQGDLDDLDEISRNNRMDLMKGRDVVTKFLQIVESQHLLGANCTAGTALNLGEGVVDRYAQDRFRVEAEVAVNRANWLTRLVIQIFAFNFNLYNVHCTHSSLMTICAK